MYTDSMKYKVMTLDLRSLNTVSGDADAVNEAVRRYDPDILCTTNLDEENLKKLHVLTEKYRIFGGGYTLLGRKHRTCIMYRKNMFTLEDGYSRFMTTSLVYRPSVITTGILIDGDTRLNILCAAVNRPSSWLASRLVDPWLQVPHLVICGDFDQANLSKKHTELVSVRTESFGLKDMMRVSAGGYRAEDHIYVSQDITALHAETVDGQPPGARISGRVPVYAELEV